MPERLRHLRPFDLFNEDRQECVGFLVEGETIEDSLYHYSLETGLNSFNRDTAAYIQKVVEYRGIKGWQTLSVRGEMERPEKLRSEVDRLFAKA
jgi:hypothetical protein